MRKKASEVVKGDVLAFWEEAKHEEDDICYLYEVTEVAQVTAGPLFNPQTVIEISTVEVETDHPMSFQYHPDVEVLTQDPQQPLVTTNNER
jgi:hypothetical protein